MRRPDAALPLGAATSGKPPSGVPPTGGGFLVYQKFSIELTTPAIPFSRASTGPLGSGGSPGPAAS